MIDDVTKTYFASKPAISMYDRYRFKKLRIFHEVGN